MTKNIKKHNISKLLKNIRLIGFYDYTVILTYLSLLSAVMSIISASKEKVTLAIFLIFISGFCDAFDGAVARTKKNRTTDEKSFGIQLDSLCDIVSFGITPAIVSYYLGLNSTIGIIIIFLYVLCALIRLAYFNVLEISRQKKEDGCTKYYHGLPVTTISVIYPIVYLLKFIVEKNTFIIITQCMLLIVAFLFILDFKIKKIDFGKLFIK